MKNCPIKNAGGSENGCERKRRNSAANKLLERKVEGKSSSKYIAFFNVLAQQKLSNKNSSHHFNMTNFFFLNYFDLQYEQNMLLFQ